ncbi:MAG: hypothetical protein NWP98_08540 [Erythrobacter sp.]|nr:hypothetical protein [Erythrobacter sp.]
MLFSFRRHFALGCAVLIVPFAAAATAPETPTPATAAASEEAAQQPAPDAGDKPDETANVDDKRICRHVRLDASSRRKTKICRTTEEWRELNNPR